MLTRKLSSRKFLIAVVAAAAAFVMAYTGHQIPWEAMAPVVAYIFGEAGVDVVRDIRGKKLGVD